MIIFCEWGAEFMKLLQMGDIGPSVQFLQLALKRAGTFSTNTTGVFGTQTRDALVAFQRARGLKADGIAGAQSHKALEPYYLGYALRTIRAGDTLYRISTSYGSSISAIMTANPTLQAGNLRVGQKITVPLNFAVTPTDIDWCSETVNYVCRGLAGRYPFIKLKEIGRSVMGKAIWELSMGGGEARAFYNGAHHANEWITVPLFLKFCEDLASAYARNGEIYGYNAREMLSLAKLSIVPCVDIDAIDLVTGELKSGAYYEKAADIVGDYPAIPFPSGWKANIEGVDLNLQYPADWEKAKEIKYAQGFVSPAPRDYVGSAALSAPESKAVYEHTLKFNPHLTLSYHTQGEVIYWKFLDYEPQYSRDIAEALGDVSGYFVEETPYASGFAGYKDWFIQNYDRPGYTIEAGAGTNPLPIRDFGAIYEDNIGILSLALKIAGRLWG